MEIIYHDLNRFAAIPNETIDDADNLDIPALGLLTTFLRHRSGRTVTLEQIGLKYGHGETALANMMALLQVARYIVKLRVQGTSGHWTVSLIVSSVRLGDEDVAEYVRQVQQRPETRDVEVIEPKPNALKRVAERNAKRAERQAKARAKAEMV